MKLKIAKALALIIAMVCLFCFPVPASAAAQGTDGTELEVMQPAKLDIQLGEAWAGVAFELKTDAGMYPGVITVGEDGVLRLEIGGSDNYILSCLNSTVEVPAPTADETAPVTEPSEGAGTTEVRDDKKTVPNETIPAETEQGTVGGIPVTHMVLFIGGLIIAVGALIGIHFYQKGSGENGNFDDEDEEI